MATPLYVDYQVSFRDAAHHAGLAAEWNAKTGEQKELWRGAFVRILGRQDQVQEKDEEVINLRADFDEGYDNGIFDIRSQADFDGYIGYLRTLQGEYQDLASRYTALRQGWLHLRAVESGQNGIPESLQNAMNEADAAGNRAAQMIDLARLYNSYEGDPPVVEDAQGRRRMPVAWLGLGADRAKMRYTRKLAEDVAAEDLGIDPMILDDEDDEDDEDDDEPGEGREQTGEQEAGTRDANGEDQESIKDKGDDDDEDWEGLEDYSDADEDEEDLESIDSELSEFAEPNAPGDEENLPNDRWVPQYKTGGGCSTGYIWLKIDPNEAILDRLFRKDTFLNSFGWLNPVQWECDVRDPNNKMPLEMVITDSMAKLQSLKHSVKLRVDPDRSHIDDDIFVYRMYLAYAPFQDLATLMDSHNGPVNPINIPEPFVWYVAESLVRAGMAMRQGDENGSESDKAAWKEIIHRDLKPSNVFLDLPSNDLYPKYATPILGDYGIAVKTDDNDPLNPRFYRDAGTRGFYPPEQQEEVDRNDLTAIDDFSLTEKTNVFGVGLILWCLVMNRAGPPEPVWVANPDDDETLAIEDPGDAWSDEIKAVIRMCLNYYPDDRPTFQEMLDVIEVAMSPDYDLSIGMQDGSAPPVVQIASMPRFGNEVYAKWGIRPAPRL